MWMFISMWISLLLHPQYHDQITYFPYCNASLFASFSCVRAMWHALLIWSGSPTAFYFSLSGFCFCPSSGDPCIDVYYTVLWARGQCPLWDCLLSCLLIWSTLFTVLFALVELGLFGGYFLCSSISSRTYSHPSFSSTVTLSHFHSSLSLVKSTLGTRLSFSNLTLLFTSHMTCLFLGLWSACWEWKIFLLSAVLHLSTSHIHKMRNVMLAAVVSRVLFLTWKPRQIKFVLLFIVKIFILVIMDTSINMLQTVCQVIYVSIHILNETNFLQLALQIASRVLGSVS
jgi:hypothetical protein